MIRNNICCCIGVVYNNILSRQLHIPLPRFVFVFEISKSELNALFSVDCVVPKNALSESGVELIYLSR